jgi:heat shock protein HtpX
LAILFAFPAALFAMIFLLSYLAVMTDILSPDETNVFYAVAGDDFLGQALQFALMVFPAILVVAFIWITIAYFAGGKIILGMTQAHRITLEENRDLFRLVENTAIMAGLPTPEICLIDDSSMNAFATGRSPKSGTITLTRGIVDKLSKAELQAVIAHELAHIGNRDTRLMLIVVAGIGCFTFFGQLLLRSVFRSRSRRNGKAALVLLMVAVACLLFGYVVAPLLRFALSRRREYQADATAVRITRDPEALSQALAKIALAQK